MTTKLETLDAAIKDLLGDRLLVSKIALDELTIEVAAKDYFQVMMDLRDSASTHFEECVDLCGVDYSTYGDGAWSGARFAVVSHLLSIKHNWRLRVRVFAQDDDFPVIS